mgnify:FL=1
MKKLALSLFPVVFCLLLPLFLVGCGETEVKQVSEYSLDIAMAEDCKSLFAVEQINYVNNSENSLKEIRFHLYPNAFRQDAKSSPVSVSEKTEAYPNGDSFGQIDIKNVYYPQGNLDFQIGGEDYNILIVTLPEELFPEEIFSLSIDFEVTLANVHHRLGYGDNTVNCANFYPIACVYKEGEGWSENLYHSNGDPFYSDVANYEVKITYPSSYSLASTGKVTNQEEGEECISHIEANMVRDFAFVLSQKFDKVSQTVGDVTVSYYGYVGDQNINSCLDTSVKAFQYFCEKFGSYPYQNLSIVKSNFVYGGMEFPNLVLISDDCNQQNDYDYVIVHEIAHQWWYGLVGNDEYNYAWQDESLTEFSTWLFFKDNSGYGLDYNALVENATNSYKYFVKVYSQVLGDVDTSIERPLDKFETQPEYAQCVYTKGALMFATMQEMVGEKKMNRAMQSYFEKFAYQNATPADLIATFNKATGYNLEGFFRSWLDGKVVIE